MADDTKNHRDNDESSSGLHRREFVGLTMAAGLAATAGSAAAALDVEETNVDIKTPDGTCDAAFFHPKTGTYAGVLIWTDAFGLRPSLRGIGRRLAAEGYSVLVPNPFYRVAKDPFPDASTVNFTAERPKINSLMTSVNTAGNAEKDAVAYVAFLDAQKQVDKKKKIGVQGYCMGGPLVLRASATIPDRIGAGASFHGGGLVSDQPSSPHLLAPKIKARLYFGIATSDDKQRPDDKVKLKEAFPAAKIEVYANAMHGWCIPDMPAQANGMPTYNQADAERAWGELLALYKTALA
jgi:carboxymethylenebutenolidase